MVINLELTYPTKQGKEKHRLKSAGVVYQEGSHHCLIHNPV